MTLPYRSAAEIVDSVMPMCTHCDKPKVECGTCLRIVCQSEIVEDGCHICSPTRALYRLQKYGMKP